MAHLILMVFAFVLFIVAAVWKDVPRIPHPGWLGLACWVLATIWR